MTALITIAKRIPVTALILSTWTGTAFGQNEDANSLRDQYLRAHTLYSERKYDEAQKALDELWLRSKTHDVATLLGQLEKRKGNHVDAARYFAYAVKKVPPTEDAKKVDVLRKWYEEEKKHVATYEVTANVSGATLSVDGTSYGITPLEVPLFVSAGRHLVLPRLEGYKGGDALLDAAQGTTQKLELKLVPAEKAPEVAPSLAPAAAVPARSSVELRPFAQQPNDRDALGIKDPGVGASQPKLWILVGGGAVTLGGVVAGLVFHSRANQANDKAEGLSARLGESGCTAATGERAKDCGVLKDAREDHDRDRNLSTLALGVGGAAVVGTALYWLWPRSSGSAAAARVEVTGAATARDGWVGVRGRF